MLFQKDIKDLESKFAKLIKKHQATNEEAANENWPSQFDKPNVPEFGFGKSAQTSNAGSSPGKPVKAVKGVSSYDR